MDEACTKAALDLLAMQPLTFEDWHAKLAPEFVRQGYMTDDEARKYVNGAGEESWRGFWADAYSPASCFAEEISCWDDDGEEA
jgi:hypothetical protein